MQGCLIGGRKNYRFEKIRLTTVHFLSILKENKNIEDLRKKLPKIFFPDKKFIEKKITSKKNYTKKLVSSK